MTNKWAIQVHLEDGVMWSYFETQEAANAQVVVLAPGLIPGNVASWSDGAGSMSAVPGHRVRGVQVVKVEQAEAPPAAAEPTTAEGYAARVGNDGSSPNDRGMWFAHELPPGSANEAVVYSLEAGLGLWRAALAPAMPEPAPEPPPPADGPEVRSSPPENFWDRKEIPEVDAKKVRQLKPGLEHQCTIGKDGTYYWCDYSREFGIYTFVDMQTYDRKRLIFWRLPEDDGSMFAGPTPAEPTPGPEEVAEAPPSGAYTPDDFI